MPTSPSWFARLVPLAIAAAVAIVSAPGCGSDPVGAGGAGDGPRIGQASEALTVAERKARYAKIRDAANSRGINGRGFLLAGIAMDETSLCHCWSEATWACQGPSSPDCGGGPVIAGSADGPCANQQGGLGMFQFDAGTYSDTLATYGKDVLTIDGSVGHAIDFVIHIVKISNYTTNAATDAMAKQWLASFDINNATLRDEWIKTVVNYYNGCPPGASCWAARYKTYNDALQQVIDESGIPFWASEVDYKASFAAQSFPLASQPFELFPGETKAGYIDLKNEGKQTWKVGQVFLGTTQPRDVKSPLAGPDWKSPSRATTVDKDTPMGAVGRFSFTVAAPQKPGVYSQFFNVVREGVAWFSDPGHGGPADDVLEVKLAVKPSKCAAGLGATFTCQGNERIKCDAATGVVTKDPCPGACKAEPAGAVCVPAMGSGGSGGAGGAGGPGAAGGAAAGKGGSAGANGSGKAGSVGVAGTSSAGNAGSGAHAGSASTSVGAGGASFAGNGGGGGAPAIEDGPTSGASGGCRTSRAPADDRSAALGVIAGLLLFARRRRAA